MMMGAYCSFRNQLYKLIGRYIYCLLCQVRCAKDEPNLYEIAKRLMDGEIRPVENPTLDELLLQAIKLNKKSKKCFPYCGGICGGLGSNLNFTYHFLGEYAYRLLYGFGDKCLDAKLANIFNERCASKRCRDLDDLLLQALLNNE